MPNPNLVFYNSADTTANPTLTFAPENGTPSAEQTLHLWNDKGGVAGSDTAEDVLIGALSGVSGSGSYSAEGTLAANRLIEVRLVGVNGTGIVAHLTPWTPVGKGAFLSARPIPSNCDRYVEVRTNVPGGFGVVAEDVILVPYYNGISVPLGSGHYEGGAQGVLAGVGDAGFTAILAGGEITANSPADDKVDISTLIGVHEGEPYCIVAAEYTLSALDGSGATLASGESYIATVSVGSDGAGGFELHFTKSDKGTYPLPVDDRPEVPDGEKLLGYVERPQTAAIDTGDIDQTTRRWGGFALEYSAASHTVSVHGGQAIVGNRLIRRESPSPITLDASDDSWIWILPSAAFAATLDTTAPDDRALLLWKATTDGSGVTAVVDLRTWTAPNLQAIPFAKLGNLADEDKAYAVLPAGVPCYILPLSALSVGLAGLGSGSGSTVFDLEANDGGSTWTSAFTSSGSVDLRPTLAYNAANRVTSAGQVEVFKYDGGRMLRLRIDSIAAGTPTDMVGSLLIARPAA